MSFEDCYEAFFHPAEKQYDDVDELIEDYRTGNDDEHAKVDERDMTKVCLFAGIVKSLKDIKTYHENKAKGETDPKRDSEGHLEFEEDKPEMYHGWSGSWEEDNGDPLKNDIFYGVKLGAILHHAEEEAKKMVKNPRSGTSVSLPRARFHQDMSGEEVSERRSGEPASVKDIAICRARHHYIEDETFCGDSTSAYSSMCWAHDGTVGFSHAGAGWKNR